MLKKIWPEVKAAFWITIVLLVIFLWLFGPPLIMTYLTKVFLGIKPSVVSFVGWTLVWLVISGEINRYG